MKKTINILIAIFILIFSSNLNAAQINIITTTTDLKSITKSITGDLAEVTSINSGKEDPHALTSRPSFVIKAKTADLWIRIGLELEIGWESAVLRDSRNNRIQVGAQGHLDASENIERLDVPEHNAGRENGDIHPQGNPHYWLDPLNGRIIAKNISNRLCQLFPEHADTFKGNLKSFERTLDEKMFGKELVEKVGSGATLWLKKTNGQLEEYLTQKNLTADINSWYGKLLSYKNAPIATYHRSWIYLLRRFNLKLAGELEPKPGVPPGPKYLVNMSDSLKQKNLAVILQEPFYSTKAAQMVSSKTNAEIIICPNTAYGDENCNSYLEMLDNVISKLSKALSGHK